MYTKLTQKQTQTKVNFIKNYISSHNASSGSLFDSNANVSNKNVATLEAELNKDINIQVNRLLISEKIKDLFGEELSLEYVRQIEAHEIYINDETSLKPYCVSVTMYPLLFDGLVKLGGESKAPKHLASFCGTFVNFLFSVSSQFAGAVATVEFLMYFDYFAKKDYGENYLETHTEIIKNELQHVIYAINQPAAARGYQSCFWNISLYDKYYFESLFEAFIFPDNSSPKYENVSKLQKFFMKWFNKEREKAVLTFPVITAATLTKDNQVYDKDFEDFCAEELSEGNSFFIYQSDNADTLSSCCFDGEEHCLIKTSNNGVEFTTFKEIATRKHDNKKNLTIYHDGSWCAGKSIIVNRGDKQMFQITTSNKKSIKVTADHLFPTLLGDKRVDELTTEDYLLFNSSVLDTFPEKDEKLSYKQGVLIGAYLGDGSRYKKEGSESYETTLSLNSDKVDTLSKILDKNIWNIYPSKNNTVFAKTSNKEVYHFISRWVEGRYAHVKRLNMDCLLQSQEFRQGILDGYYITDGGNSNRIYTTSTGMKVDLEILCNSLGYITICDVDDRTEDIRQFRDEKPFSPNYAVQCIRWYNPKNKRSMGNVFIKRNGNLYFKVNEVALLKDYNEDVVYCFEMKDKEEPYFTLPNGMITHNCRLQSKVADNTFSYSLGAGGVSTGSINVITLNMNRIIQQGINLSDTIDKVHKYQIAYRSLMTDYKEAGMLPVYDAGFISLDKQFLTIGINGMVEAAEYLGIEISDNDQYREFINSNLKIIYDKNKKIKEEYGFMFNTEFVPAENLGVKNAGWDRKDGLVVNRDCYNSYFYAVENSSNNVLDKFRMHGNEYVKYLDGGSAYHCNLEEYPTKEGFKKLLNVAASTGCNYFCFNVKVTVCNDCDYINKHTKSNCTKCGSDNVDYATRIIGYLKKVTDYSKDRQKEEKQRYYAEV